MKRELRKRAVDSQRAAKVTDESMGSFDEDAFPVDLSMPPDYFVRDEFSNFPSVVAATFMAVENFISKEMLEVTIVTEADKVPTIPDEFDFSGTELECSASRMREGEAATIAVVKEEGLVVGYGIAIRMSDYTDIHTIDTDKYSRRSTGLFYKYEIEGKTFKVGVGHVIVKALIEYCDRPLCTNAATDSSENVFESLGFSHVHTPTGTQGVMMKLA
jgi:hypothetical protein